MMDQIDRILKEREQQNNNKKVRIERFFLLLCLNYFKCKRYTECLLVEKKERNIRWQSERTFYSILFFYFFVETQIRIIIKREISFCTQPILSLLIYTYICMYIILCVWIVSLVKGDSLINLLRNKMKKKKGVEEE